MRGILTPLMLAICNAASGQVTQVVSPSPVPGANFGDAASVVPDVNGDGFADFAIGAWGELVNGFLNSGRLYLISGADGVYIRHISPPNDEADQYFAESVAGSPDLDGDMQGDVVVGAPDADPDFSPEDCGRVHVYSGSTGTRLYTLASPNQVANGHFGDDVAVIPDLNGDGRWDIIVGASGENTAVPRSGRAYLFSGANGVLIRSLQSPTPEFGADFGDSVSWVPDINGDGAPDIIIGAPKENPGASPVDCGRAYVFSGATGALLRSLQSPAQDPGGGFGESVVGLADMNGDGRGEVVVGAPFENPGLSPSNCGRVYIYSGGTGAYIAPLVPPQQQLNGNFGFALCTVPDRTGDGRQEILVGAPRETPGSNNPNPGRFASVRTPGAQGRAHLYAGATWNRLATFASPKPSANGGFGRSVTAAAMPGGLLKLGVGAPREWWNVSAVGAGRAYLISY